VACDPGAIFVAGVAVLKGDGEIITQNGATKLTFINSDSGVWLVTLGMLFRYVFSVVIYLPVLCTGYYLSNLALSPLDHSLGHLVLVLLFSYLVYLGVFFLKGVSLALKARGNIIWLFLFMVCVAFTCLLSPWLVAGPLSRAFLRWHLSSWLVWVLTFWFGYLIYNRYKFHVPSAPVMARFAYQFGFNLAGGRSNRSNEL
jgi:hypothetical protein